MGQPFRPNSVAALNIRTLNKSGSYKKIDSISVNFACVAIALVADLHKKIFRDQNNLLKIYMFNYFY